MIAKAKSIAHGGVSIGYITRQGKAQVVKLNHLPEDASPQAIYGYMKLHQKLREEEFQRRPLKNNISRYRTWLYAAGFSSRSSYYAIKSKL